jgi:hypothetical protein
MYLLFSWRYIYFYGLRFERQPDFVISASKGIFAVSCPLDIAYVPENAFAKNLKLTVLLLDKRNPSCN